jgi:hypothetical protein
VRYFARLKPVNMKRSLHPRSPYIGNYAAHLCKTPRRVTKAQLINALHQSLMQFNAITEHEDLRMVDNRATVNEINRLMSRAGHVGFVR